MSKAFGLFVSSVTLFGLLIVAAIFPATAQGQTFVQVNAALPASGSQVAATYTLAQGAGNLNVVIVGWNDTTTTVTSVTDTKGNSYVLAVGPALVSGTLSQSIYYAPNITAAAAGTNTVTVKFSGAANYPDVRILEYSGLDKNNPLDVAKGATGSNATSDSGALTTTNPNDLLVGANIVVSSTSAAGSGYTKRIITDPDGDIAQDEVVTATGAYHATASLTRAAAWIMQIVAFRAAGSAPTPTAPTNLAATVISSSQINLSWTASTESGGTIANYLVERCQGASCTTFAQIGTSTTTTFNDAGLTASTSYSYRVRAKDTANNLSAYSNTATGMTQSVGIPTPTPPTNLTAMAGAPGPVVIATQAYINGTSLSSHTTAAFNSSGADLIVISASSHMGVIMTPSDSFGNAWTSAAGPTNTTMGDDLLTQVWYARFPTVGAGHTVSIGLSTADSLVISVLVVKGSNISTPLAAISAIGDDGGTQSLDVASPNITTSTASNLLIGFAKSGLNTTWTAGTGFTNQNGASSNFLDAETALAATPGTYNANFVIAGSTTWQAVVMAVNPSPAAASPTQVNLAWTASTETGGTVANYLIERCQGASCTAFAQIGMSAQPNYTDTSVTPATTYTYRVRAIDTANTVSAYSATVTATVPAGPVPTAPTNLAASASSNTQIDLTWTAATETGGTIANYLIERCQGASCTTFTQIGTSVSPAFSDAGLLGSTSYSYRVRAVDTGNTAGPYSNTATATTPAPTFLAPANLAVTGTTSTQVSLAWTAATETGGTITNYLVERCQGASCTTFTQIGTSVSTAFSDAGLLGSTSYSYRVRATDATSDFSGYSNTATGTTAAPTLTAPTGLTGTAISSTQINLAWTAATETGGTITNYLVERCQGASCTTFTQIGTSVSTAFSDAGLLGSTSYSYRVRATDGTNLGPYSSTAGATTQAPTLTAPTGLTGTAISSTQINLSWTAATETGGTITNYLVERCQGASCTTFTQIGTSASTAFNDTGLTASTSYRYRVRATDGTNLGPYSSIVTTATPAGPVPTAPGSLTATAASSTQINLSWTASTESGGTIASYLVERCQGASCATFAQIGTSTTTTFNDAGLTGSTSYSYRVRAKDAANVTGPYSATATATTSAPTLTAPAGLTATAASSTQINLSWTAATETGGTINGYLVERCQGASCTTFTQVGTSTTTTFNDTGLTASTNYSYRVRAKDAANNMGPYSGTASATTLGAAPPTVSFVQVNATLPASGQTLTVPFALAQTAGDLNVVVVGWNDTTATVTSVTDTKGNVYTLAAGPTVVAGTLTQAVYYAKSIAAAAAGANTVTVKFNAGANYPDVRIAEYAGLDTNNPLDAAASAAGNSATSDSGAVTTTNANDLLVGANTVASSTSAAGTGYAKRIITNPDADILEDEIVATTGSYHATATLTRADAWIMQAVAFKASGAIPSPTAPSNLTATAATSTQINLAWTASTETGGTIMNYLVERCQGAACSNFAQVGTVAGTSFGDSGLTASTSYSYRVRAQDTANTLGPYSTVATTTTLPALAPTAPGSLTATAASSSQINLSWTAATETGGTVASYSVERCQGAGCTNFVVVGTSITTTLSDTGLVSSTTYSYRARAEDALNNFGPYSNTASATTQASGTPTPSAPGNLTATPGAPGPTVIATQAYINGTSLPSHTTAAFDSSGADLIVISASSHMGVTMTPSDSLGNTWISIAGPTSTTLGDDIRTQVWYSRLSAAGPGHTITVSLSAADSLVISVIVVKGSNTTTPIAAVSAIGDDGGTQTFNVTSPSITTTTSNSLLIGFAKSSQHTTWDPGTGFTAQPGASSSFLDAETALAVAPGSYSATFGVSGSTTWQAVVVAVNPSAAAGNSNQVNLNWTASTETGGTIANYLIERCQGAGCTTFSQIGTSATITYNDTSVTHGTSYTYRVRAVDTASSTGPYSNTASATP